MDVFVKTYQIRNGNIKGGKSIDEIPLLDVSEFGEVSKYLEEDATEFRMDSLSLKTEFLPKSFFNDYEPQTPYLLEVQVGSGWDAPDSRCVFYGPIKKKSIKYNERTEVTSFEASSWSRAIKQAGDVIARDRMPVRVADGFENKGGGTKDIAVAAKAPDDQLKDIVERGAILDTEAEMGEEKVDFRFLVTGEEFDSGNTSQGSNVYGFPVATGSPGKYRGQGSTNGGLWFPLKWGYPEKFDRYGRNIGSKGTWMRSQKRIAVPKTALGSSAKSLIGAEITITVDETAYNKGKTTTETKVTDGYEAGLLDGPEWPVGPLDTQKIDRGMYATLVLEDKVGGGALRPDITIGNNPPPKEDSISLPTQVSGNWEYFQVLTVKADTKGTLLSSDAYGQDGQKTRPYDPVEVSEGLATRTPALADLLDNNPVVRGNPGNISRKFRFDESLINAAGDIQRSSEMHLSFQPWSYSGGSERKSGGARRVKAVIKTRQYEAQRSPISLPDTIEWKGEALGDEPDAVVVEGSDIVNVVSDRDKVYGWFPAEALDDPNEIGDAESLNVVKVEAPLIEAVIDDGFEAPDNIPSIKGRAKRYYSFYSAFYKEKEAVVDGVFDHVPGLDYEEPIIGASVSEDDSVKETGVVIEQSVDYQKEETTLTILVSDNYTKPTNAAPVAILHSPNEVTGSGTVVLDASSSYDPNGDSISFTWYKNGSEVTGESGRILEINASDQDFFKVVVEDSDGATDNDTTRVDVEDLSIGGNSDRKPTLLVRLDEGASTDTDRVFSVEASKRNSDLKVDKKVFMGGELLNEENLATNVNTFSGSTTVTRDTAKLKLLSITAHDLASGTTRRVERLVDPSGYLSGGNIDNFIEANSDATQDEWSGFYVFRGRTAENVSGGTGLISKGLGWDPNSDRWGVVDVDAADGFGARPGTFKPLRPDITGGANIEVTETALGDPTVSVSPQGVGSDLDSDTVDGYESDDIAVLAEQETITAQWTYDETIRAKGGLITQDNIGSESYNAGRFGWDVDEDGHAFFASIEANEIITERFTTNITQALAGSDLLLKSQAKLAEPFSVPERRNLEDETGAPLTDESGQTLSAFVAPRKRLTDENGDIITTENGDPLLLTKSRPLPLHVEDFKNAANTRVFESGDWVQIKLVRDLKDSGEVWGRVYNYTDSADGTQRWSIKIKGVTPGVIGKTISSGSQVFDYGTSGQGIIRRTVIGASGPYTITETWEGDPMRAERYDPKVVNGNLDAAPPLPGGRDPSGFGLYSTNAYLKGSIIADEGRIADSVLVGSTGASTAGEIARISEDLKQVGGSLSKIDTVLENALENGTTLIKGGVIDTNLVVSDSIAAGQITSSEISADTITSSEISAGTITANELDAGAVTADDISADGVFAQNADIEGTLTMGNSGVITTNTNEFTINQNGLELKYGGDFNTENSIDWVENGNVRASIGSESNYGGSIDYAIAISSDLGVAGDIRGDILTASTELRIKKPYNIRQSHYTKSDLSDGEIRFYFYNPNPELNGSLELWCAIRGSHQDPDDWDATGNFGKSEIAAV